MVTTIGIDGARALGWVAVRLQDGVFSGAAASSSLLEISQASPEAAAIAVDIPIGYSENGPRQADAYARKFLGGARASAVFSTPVGPALRAATYQLAVEASRAATGQGLSKQAYELRGRILEAEEASMTDARIFEVHPEVSFSALAIELGESPRLPSKKTWTGFRCRLRLLSAVGIDLPAELGKSGGAAPDDLLDAAVAAWSAGRKAAGRARCLPDSPEIFKSGASAIWY